MPQAGTDQAFQLPVLAGEFGPTYGRAVAEAPLQFHYAVGCAV